MSEKAYRVLQREHDKRWCIYTPKYSVIVAEFVTGSVTDALAIKRILQALPVGWIKVSAGLPDSDQAVLVYAPADDEPIWIGMHDGEKWCSPDGEPLVHLVTHWMQMPELPKEVA